MLHGAGQPTQETAAGPFPRRTSTQTRYTPHPHARHITRPHPHTQRRPHPRRTRPRQRTAAEKAGSFHKEQRTIPPMSTQNPHGLSPFDHATLRTVKTASTPDITHDTQTFLNWVNTPNPDINLAETLQQAGLPYSGLTEHGNLIRWDPTTQQTETTRLV